MVSFNSNVVTASPTVVNTQSVKVDMAQVSTAEMERRRRACKYGRTAQGRCRKAHR